MVHYLQIGTIGSIGFIILTILEVQVVVGCDDVDCRPRLGIASLPRESLESAAASHKQSRHELNKRQREQQLSRQAQFPVESAVRNLSLQMKPATPQKEKTGRSPLPSKSPKKPTWP